MSTNSELSSKLPHTVEANHILWSIINAGLKAYIVFCTKFSQDFVEHSNMCFFSAINGCWCTRMPILFDFMLVECENMIIILLILYIWFVSHNYFPCFRGE